MTDAGTWTWRATGTTWRIHHDGGVDERLATRAAALVEADEARWSRFRPWSDVSLLTRLAGSWVAIAPATAPLLAAAAAAQAATDGVFCPLLGRRLAAWGYVDGPGSAAPEAAPRAAAFAGGAIEVAGAPGRERARIPAGCALDLGGIAKTWIAVRVADLLATEGAGTVAVSAGGDVVAARGAQVIELEPVEGHPQRGACRVGAGGGVATSSSERRAWRLADGVRAHHLIDPATGDPCAAGCATVADDDPLRAEVGATVAVVRPASVLAGPLAVLLRGPDGSSRASAAWGAVAVAEAVAA